MITSFYIKFIKDEIIRDPLCIEDESIKHFILIASKFLSPEIDESYHAGSNWLRENPQILSAELYLYLNRKQVERLMAIIELCYVDLVSLKLEYYQNATLPDFRELPNLKRLEFAIRRNSSNEISARWINRLAELIRRDQLNYLSIEIENSRLDDSVIINALRDNRSLRHLIYCCLKF